MTRTIIALTLVLALPTAAAAQPTAATPPRTQEFNFTDQLVEGSLERPDGASVRPRRAHAGPSLLRIRAHFVPEMLRSVEHL